MSGEGEELLVEQRVERPQVAPYARRVTAAGAFLECSHTLARWDGKEWHFDPQPAEWRLQWRLRPQDLDELRAAIRESGFFDLAPDYVPTGTAIGGSDVTWTASLDGRTHSVTLHAHPAVSVPEIEALERRLNAVLQAAADAARQAGELSS